MSLNTDSITCDLDFDRDGKQIGNLNLRFSDNKHAFDNIGIPVAIVKNGVGPTILLSAGNHGDEYEGQVILRRLVHEVNVNEISGRIIILPALNYPAVLQNTRVSPLDNGNLNRSFPGRDNGQPTSSIAHFVTSKLLPMCSAGIDLHSGGRATSYLSCAFLCSCKDPQTMKNSLELSDIFNAPFTFVVRGESSGSGFDPAAQAIGIPFISAELAGGGNVDIQATKIGSDGVNRVLQHLGIRASREVLNNGTRYLNGIDGSRTVSAPYSGIFEPYWELGDTVEADQVAGVLYSLEEIERQPLELRFLNNGIVMVKRNSARVRRGGHLYLVAEEFSRKEMLERLES